MDTLLVAEDLASLVTVNHYFLGGAYIDPNYTGTRTGILGTRGMVLAANTDAALERRVDPAPAQRRADRAPRMGARARLRIRPT